MPKTEFKKPTLENFKKALEMTGGNLSNAAKLLNCERNSITRWAKNDAEFAAAIEESRKKMLDTFVDTARIVAMGKMVLDDKKQFVGWEIPPDPQMLRYFMSTLGRDEGFGEEVVLHHTADEGVDVTRWIDKEIEEKQKHSQSK